MNAIEFLSAPDTGSKIVKFIEKHLDIKIPRSGFLAGQSVAEAVFRLLDVDVQTRIKDVDIFHNSRRGYSAYRRRLNPEIVYEMKKDKTVDFQNKAKEYIGHGSFQEGGLVTNLRSIKIHSTFNSGFFNIIYAPVNNSASRDIGIQSDDNFEEILLEEFDVNIVKVGVCLRTKKVFFNESFIEFIKTKQLKLCTFVTPVKSLIRYINKSKFDGVYSDIDGEAKRVALYCKIMGEEFVTGKQFIFHIDRFNELEKNVTKHLFKYFNPVFLKGKKEDSKEWVYFSAKETTHLKKHFKMIKNSLPVDKNNKLVSAGGLYKDLFIAQSKNLELLMNQSWLNKVNQLAVTRVSKIRLCYTISEIYLFLSYGVDIFRQKISELKNLSGHVEYYERYRKDYSIKEMSDFVRKCEKNKLNTLLGFVEKGIIRLSLVIDNDNISELFKVQNVVLDKLAKQSACFSEASLELINKFNEESSDNHIVYKILRSSVETSDFGERMRICIGGRWPSVNRGKAFLFEIINKNDNQRYALQVNIDEQKNKKITFNLYELRGKRNGPATDEIKKSVSEFVQWLNKNNKLHSEIARIRKDKIDKIEQLKQSIKNDDLIAV